MNLYTLIKKEGWAVRKEGDKEIITAYGEDFPFTHPALIHLKRYRTEKNPESKYHHMWAVDRYFWPTIDSHAWTERRYRAHCEDWNYISMAAGASASKSFDMARIALIFWFANPQKRSVIIASTTLESLGARIWGYATSLINKMQVKIPYQYLGGNTPKILYPSNTTDGKIRDTIHGMFAVSAKQGSDETVISSWIGRHPEDSLMLVLDESTDMPPALTKSLANLDSSEKQFQCWAIGNSNSKFDLHGMLSTPRVGWENIDPMKTNKWETNQKKGVCLFFSCYESPTIYEQDPDKKRRLSKFLITKEQIDEKEKYYGKDSDSFWRFVFGFWRSTTTDSTVISKAFLNAYKVNERAEWSGLYTVRYLAGLDPAFSVQGDDCILRLAKYGVTTNGLVCLDYGGDSLVFKLLMLANSPDAVEIQIAKQVVEKLRAYNIPITDLCIDCTGQGRAIGGVIQLQMNSLVSPIKIYTVKEGNKKVNSLDVEVRTPLEMYGAFRDYMMQGQIKGLDYTATQQLTTRLIVKKLEDSKPKLESKKAYKTRMAGIMPSLGHSPDNADAAALVLQLAILNYGFSPGQRKVVAQQLEFHHEKMYNHMMGIKMIEEKHEAPHATPSGFTQVGKAGGSFKKFY